MLNYLLTPVACHALAALLCLSGEDDPLEGLSPAQIVMFCEKYGIDPSDPLEVSQSVSRAVRADIHTYACWLTRGGGLKAHFFWLFGSCLLLGNTAMHSLRTAIKAVLGWLVTRSVLMPHLSPTPAFNSQALLCLRVYHACVVLCTQGLTPEEIDAYIAQQAASQEQE